MIVTQSIVFKSLLNIIIIKSNILEHIFIKLKS